VVTLVIGLPLLLAGIGWSAFAFVGALARTSEHHHVTYPWSGGNVTLDVGSGNATIRTSDAASVGVDYTEHYEFKRPTVKATSSAGGLALTSHCDGGPLGENCSINYVITVPKQAGLRLHLGDGNVHLEGVAESVVVQSGDGDIDGTGLLSKSVQVSSGDGDIHLQWAASPARVQLSMGDGNIDLAVPQGSGPYAIRQSGSGSSDIGVATAANATDTMVLHSGDGDVHVGYGG
jgi:hypothetical protein